MPKKTPPAKNPAAQALAKQRWANVPAAERSRIASEMAKACSDQMTPEERSARARKAVEAREAKRRAELGNSAGNTRRRKR